MYQVTLKQQFYLQLVCIRQRPHFNLGIILYLTTKTALYCYCRFIDPERKYGYRVGFTS